MGFITNAKIPVKSRIGRKSPIFRRRRMRTRNRLRYIHTEPSSETGRAPYNTTRRSILHRRAKAGITFWSKKEISRLGKIKLPKSLDLDNEDYSSW